MISRADFSAYNQAVGSLVDQASRETQRQISAWMRINPDASVAEIREFAKNTMEGLSQVYGEAAASLAAEWYDVQMMASKITLSPAITEVTYSLEQIKKVSHYQAKKLVEGDIDGFLDSCGEYIENNVKQSLNDTILSNVARDKEHGVRFVRVTTGAETCAFCYMLSSRGAAYWTRKTAGEQNHYHRRCDCKIVPGFEDNQDAAVVEGYDPKGMRDRMALIEDQTGLRFGNRSDMSALTREMKLRNVQWLMNGMTPEPGYENEEARALKYQTKQSTMQHEKELKTAERIAKYGFDVTFIVDEVTIDGKRIGLPDLKSNLEIKTLEDATSYNTINGYLKSASKKKAQAIIFDNYENSLEDDTLVEMINRSQSFSKGSVYIYTQEGNVLKIR